MRHQSQEADLDTGEGIIRVDRALPELILTDNSALSDCLRRLVRATEREHGRYSAFGNAPIVD